MIIKFYKWRQLPVTSVEKMRHWQLYSKETGIVVVDIKLSKYSEPRYDYWVRKKIQKAYEHYDDKVWFGALRFF